MTRVRLLTDRVGDVVLTLTGVLCTLISGMKIAVVPRQ